MGKGLRQSVRKARVSRFLFWLRKRTGQQNKNRQSLPFSAAYRPHRGKSKEGCDKAANSPLSSEKDDFYQVQGEVDEFQGVPQLRILRLRKAAGGEIDPAELSCQDRAGCRFALSKSERS